ncbi:MAG: alpha-ketoglutarate-dependent dioxygenase AlkB [Gemmatimonadaceae bacterium]
MAKQQFDFFAEAPKYPEGFKYQPAIITPDHERDLIEHIKALPLREFEFHGFTGKRRVKSFGWHYDFGEEVLKKTEEIPSWVLPLRDVVAGFAGIQPDEIQHVLTTEYDHAGIGWHRDKATFDDIIGVSLLAPCTFRLRRKVAGTWERVSLEAEPRSVYLMRGPSRTEWEHSIPTVEGVRYSITFRTLRQLENAKRMQRRF